jgi:hypothetical protein
MCVCIVGTSCHLQLLHACCAVPLVMYSASHRALAHLRARRAWRLSACVLARAGGCVWGSAHVLHVTRTSARAQAPHSQPPASRCVPGAGGCASVIATLPARHTADGRCLTRAHSWCVWLCVCGCVCVVACVCPESLSIHIPASALPAPLCFSRVCRAAACRTLSPCAWLVLAPMTRCLPVTAVRTTCWLRESRARTPPLPRPVWPPLHHAPPPPRPLWHARQ